MKRNTVILFYPAPWEGDQRGRIPYALLYLERVIRDLPLNVILIDEQVQKDYLPIVEAHKDTLMLVGVSAMTGYQLIGASAFSRRVKQVFEGPVVWGGWHPTLLPEQVLQESFVDLVVVGQGEKPFRELVQKLMMQGDYSSIAGLGHKKNGAAVINPAAQFTDINQFPNVNYDLIDLDHYVFKSAYAERCIGYFSSHGCPYHCAFCCVAEVYGRKWYHKDVATIIDDLRHIKKIAHIDSITFDDDNFFIDRKFTLELCEAIVASNLNITWDTSAHAGLFLKLFTADDIDLFYRAGCRQIYIGAESGDQRILDLIAKHATVEDNYAFVRALNRHNIIPLFSTMVCFPNDPDRDIALTLDMIRKAKLIDNRLRARIFFYTPYPGTELYKESIKKGFVPPARLEDWAKHTLRKFRAPWWTRDYRRQLEIFANFYLPLMNPYFYTIVPKKFRMIAFAVNNLFFPFVYIRFKFNLLRFPVEAVLFLAALKTFNRIFNRHFSLGFESYFD